MFRPGTDNNMRCAARLTWRCDPVGSLLGRAYWKIGCTHSPHIHAVNALSYRRCHVVVRRWSGRGKRRGAQSTIQTCVDECSVSLVTEFCFLQRGVRWLGKRGFNRGGLVDMAQFGAFVIRFNSYRKTHIFPLLRFGPSVGRNWYRID